MRRFLFVILFIFSAGAAFSFQFKGDIYGELAGQDINSSSYFNPGNMHQVGDRQYYMRSNLIFKNDFSEYLNGVVNVEGQYYPAYYTLFHPYAASDPNAQANNTKERLFIKEAYLNLMTSAFVFSMGKQYIKWGKGTFFNPSDVINFNRDPLRPKDEAEGNPFVSMALPIQSFLTLEAITVVENKENQQRTSLSSLPFIPKLSFSAGSFGGFVFGVFQNNKKPIYGLNLDYAFSLGENSSITLYAEGIYLMKSYRQRVSESLTYEPMPDKNYQAVSAGTRIQTPVTSLKWLEGVSISLEYYYNNENWSKNDLIRYYNKLDTTKSNINAHVADILYFEPYKNSWHYGYAGLYLTNFIKQNLTFGQDFVMNFEDHSFLYMPSLVFSFDNTNAEVGLKSIVYIGSNKSEFGNSISKFNIIGFTQISF